MKVVAMLVVLALSLPRDSAAQSMPSWTSGPDAMNSPIWIGMSLLNESRYAELEATARAYVESDRRSDDGLQAIHLLGLGVNHWVSLERDDGDTGVQRRIAEWRERHPDSALQPIVEAMYATAIAWRARGRGEGAIVTAETRRVFEERNRQAWKILAESEARSSTLPLWYAQAIQVGLNLELPDAELRRLFDDGIRKHPENHSIYASYLRSFVPAREDGWISAREFIGRHAASPNSPDSDALYARLYELLDEANARPIKFFEESRADWPRMRRGYMRLIETYPQGPVVYAQFALFACRASDAATYRRLRGQLALGVFADLAPEGISVDVCDARLKAKPGNTLPKAPPPGQWEPSTDRPLTPDLLGQNLFSQGRFSELEDLIGGYIQSDTRAADGTQALWYLTYGVDARISQLIDDDERTVVRLLSEWRAQFPQSTVRPVFESSFFRATAWRARGEDFGSTVAP
jgi:hypothetical protein